MSTQIFTTIPQQIEILKSRGLSFRSEEFAADELQRHGYYNIINGYKDNYVIKDANGERYKDTVCFEQVYSLFSLDHDIRNSIMITMLDIEEQLKSQLAFVLAEHFTAEYSLYTKISNYHNMTVRNPHFTLAATLKKLNEAYNSGKDPIRYYRETYNNVPPWVLLKGVYFSTVINFIRFLKGSQKEELFELMFDGLPGSCEKPAFKKTVADILALFKEYRNVCAHGGRIYNYIPLSPHYFDTSWIDIQSVPVAGNSGVGNLLIALMFLRDKHPFYYLSRHIESCVQNHCRQYPDDADYIVNAMGIWDIVDIRS